MSFLVPDYINRDLPLTSNQRKAIRKEAWKLWMKDWRNVLVYVAVIAVVLGGALVLGWFIAPLRFGPTGRHFAVYLGPVHRTRMVRQRAVLQIPIRTAGLTSDPAVRV